MPGLWKSKAIPLLHVNGKQPQPPPPQQQQQQQQPLLRLNSHRYAMAVELLHCALEDMKDAANRSVVKMLAAECKGRAAAAAIAASRPKANLPSSAAATGSAVDDSGGAACRAISI